LSKLSSAKHTDHQLHMEHDAQDTNGQNCTMQCKNAKKNY